MVHLSNFSAERYRGIGGLSLPRLTKVNLLTGMNGAGKSALIEAMWLFFGRHNPKAVPQQKYRSSRSHDI